MALELDVDAVPAEEVDETVQDGAGPGPVPGVASATTAAPSAPVATLSAAPTSGRSPRARAA